MNALNGWHDDINDQEDLKTGLYNNGTKPYDFHDLHKVTGLKINTDFSRDDTYDYILSNINNKDKTPC